MINDNGNDVSTIHNDQSFCGGQLSQFVQAWEELTSDPNILGIVKGYLIDFVDTPIQLNYPSELKFNEKECIFIDQQIETFLKKGIIVNSVPERGEFISNIFLRPKKEQNKFRMILNLKSLNQFIRYEHFKMDGLDKAVKMMQQNCFMASLDLCDAYFTVAIAPEHQKYLKFYYKGRLYKFVCMPQGLACGPRVFTKLLKIPYSYLRSQGFYVVGFIDDSYLQGETYDECLANVIATRDLLIRLGFVVNFEKSVLVPLNSIQYLGFILDSKLMTVTLPSEKAKKLIVACANLLHGNNNTIRKVAQVIGSLVAAFPAVPHGPLFCRSLEIDCIAALKLSRGDYDAPIVLKTLSSQDLLWWINNLKGSKKWIRIKSPSFVIYSDASLQGWGGVANNIRTGGRWVSNELSHHINYLELLAAFYNLKSYCVDMRNEHIRLYLDNVTAVAFINGMGGTRSELCNKLSHDIWVWCIDRNLWVSAAHIPGVNNSVADSESRLRHDPTEWMLSNTVFKIIADCFYHPEIDLFASRLNTQLPKYVSWRPDPGCIAVDAFSLNWTDKLLYAFPPFSLIARILQKLWEDKAQMILIVPYWSTQTWFTLLVKSFVAEPILLKPSRKLLTLPYQPELTHPLYPQLKLLACHVSGRPSDVRKFQLGLPLLYPLHGEKQRKHNTSGTLNNGINIVLHDRLIRVRQL